MIDFSIPEEDTGTIWTPSPNFPSVDLILTPNSLFQITISLHQPVKQEPLRKILEKQPVKEKISLYFVVPEESFETSTLQNYQNEQGKVSREAPKSIEMLEQWVLGVPLGGFRGRKMQINKRTKTTWETVVAQLDDLLASHVAKNETVIGGGIWSQFLGLV